ncbi:hypothetical protein JCM10296v2_005734 [Rhodotorula toruloides]
MFAKASLALAAAASLLGTTSAAPLASSFIERSLVECAPVTSVDFNVTYKSNYTEHLPKTLILATGVSNIDGMQVSNVGSESLTDEIALRLSKLANKALCAADAPYDAVGVAQLPVITHGTDTLEETAFFLDITVGCDKPVVVVGSMRPSTAISADGPNNLLQAVTTAISPNSRARGTLIVLNDRICAAYYCEKTQANTLNTFASPEPGYIGGLLSDKPFYYMGASKPTFKQVYDISNVTELPHVEIFYSYQGADFELLNTTVANGAKGVVIAGTGAGSLTDAGMSNVDTTVSAGVPVVRSTKINVGFVTPGDYPNTIASGSLNPVKSRRQLQVLLALNKTNDEIRTAFEEPLKTYLHLSISSYY